jgi:hypothetical protein
MKIARIAAAVALVSAVVAFAGVARPGEGKSDTTTGSPSITVNGNGAVTAVPDRAGFSFGVSTSGDTATKALAESSAAVSQVIAALKKAGIAEADIQTEQVSLSQRTDDNGNPVKGYTAENAVDVTVRDLSKAGTVIDAAVAAGANQVSGPELSRSDQDVLYRQALQNAMTDARAKAETLASSGNVTLGQVLDIVEGSAPAPVPMTAKAGAETTPVQPGTQEIDGSVTVTYAVS